MTSVWTIILVVYCFIAIVYSIATNHDDPVSCIGLMIVAPILFPILICMNACGSDSNNRKERNDSSTPTETGRLTEV